MKDVIATNNIQPISTNQTPIRFLTNATNNAELSKIYKMTGSGWDAGIKFQGFNQNESGTYLYIIQYQYNSFMSETGTLQTTYYHYQVFYFTVTNTSPTVDVIEMSDEYKEVYTNGYTNKSVYILNNAQNNIYGFTYNTKSKPLRPVIQIEKGTEFTDLREEHPLSVSEETSYDAEGIFFIYYVVKGEVQLDINSTYIYRAYDKYVDVGSEEVILNTKNPKSTKFTFAHVSDSQMSANDNSGAGSGVYFAQTLSQLTQNSDIIVHTGDVVQYAQYEGYWEAMLHDNFRYLSQIPMMAISGNHEVSYSSGLKETYKHFNYKLTEQTSVNKGIFYSFVYGNVKFIMLNTNDLIGTELKTEQYEWLENELKNNTATWTVVAMHNPMYSVGKWGANPEQNATSLGLRAQLQGLFAKYKVDLVLQGHDHAISRTYPIDEKGVPQREITFTDKNVEYTSNPNGVIYVMNGPAGNQARSPYATDDNLYKYQQSSQTRSWAEFEVDGNRIVVSVKYTDGMNTFMYQKWGIEKIV